MDKYDIIASTLVALTAYLFYLFMQDDQDEFDGEGVVIEVIDDDGLA